MSSLVIEQGSRPIAGTGNDSPFHWVAERWAGEVEHSSFEHRKESFAAGGNLPVSTLIMRGRVPL